MIKRKEEVSKINSLRQRLKYQMDASMNFGFLFIMENSSAVERKRLHIYQYIDMQIQIDVRRHIT